MADVQHILGVIQGFQAKIQIVGNQITALVQRADRTDARLEALEAEMQRRRGGRPRKQEDAA